jgi:acetyl esterase/lipase
MVHGQNKQPMKISRWLCRLIGLIGVVLLIGQTACAGSFRDRIKERRSTNRDKDAVTAGRVLRDVAYGQHPRQRMDVYLPRQATAAPVIFMVHGGAWRVGDKEAAAVVENKVARWVSKGFILISVNYRLLPEAAPLEQSLDVTRALVAAQDKAASWGGDPGKFILMGHSAGAHLVALVASIPEKAYKLGAQSWLGAVLLDSAALNVVQIMENKHARFYDQAFGDNPVYWRETSPIHVLEPYARPFLAVCSSHRKDSCAQAEKFAAKAETLGVSVTVRPEDLSHKKINQLLGTGGAYTEAVEAFMTSLDESLLPEAQGNAGERTN